MRHILQINILFKYLLLYNYYAQNIIITSKAETNNIASIQLLKSSKEIAKYQKIAIND